MAAVVRNRRELEADDPSGRRRLALDLVTRGLAAVEPRAATVRVLGQLAAAGTRLDGAVVIAFGKASRAMAEGVLDVCAPREGIVVGFEEGRVGALRAMASSHPVPDERSIAAGRAVMELARRVRPDDLVLCLVSGGGSAMLELPAEGVSLAQLREATERLLASGAPIEALNAARRRLSRIKGGRLAEALAPARIVNVVLSDVPGSGPEVVASGPTIPPDVSRGTVSVETWVAGDNLVAREGMVEEARRRGLRVVARDGFVAGEAREAGRRFYAECRRTNADVVVWGGETTVTLVGDGIGGRNEELVLGAFGDFAGGLLLSVGTDGVDGASEAAGALLDSHVVEAARARGLDPDAFLGRNDADTFFARTGGRIVTGPTGTNVADVCVYVA